MAHSFLIFDFGSNEDVAQQARQTIDRWRQGFRLGNKMLLKFDRGEGSEEGKAKSKAEERGETERILMIVRLDFSDHERLSHQRWIDRIPAEAPFKDAQPKVIRQNDAEFKRTAERFDALDGAEDARLRPRSAR